MTSHKTVYLDHAATTPMHPAAIEAMTAVLATVGNASSLHGTGRVARRRMEEARESLAQLLGARPSEVIFTAGGTESDNLAVKGIYWARRDSSPQRRRVVTTPIEHHAVLDAVQWLAEHEGAEVTWLPVGHDGSVAPAALREVLQAHDDVALVSIMWANNEVGTIMPICELAAIAAEFEVPMHSDAIQAVGQIPVDFTASGLSAMSVAAHKFGGPTGVGALLLRRDTSCVPLLHGGGQERDVRSGTPDVAGAVAMAAAATVAVEGLEANSARVQALRDRLVDGVVSSIGDVYLNGVSFYEVSSRAEVNDPPLRTEAIDDWTGVTDPIRDPKQTQFVWYAEVGVDETTIWANFQGFDPNSELVEINVRPAVFFPTEHHLDYITVRGFELCQAACPWTPPTADQPGLIGPNWAKGWVIEDNDIHDAKCSAISIGKESSTGRNYATLRGDKQGHEYQVEAVFSGLQIGWDREHIGSQLVNEPARHPRQ